MQVFKIADRVVGNNQPPLVIAEVGINHEGDINKAIQMVDAAYAAGCECVKFQSHIIEDEMIFNRQKPGHTTETIWDIIQRCSLTEEEEILIKDYVEQKGLLYLSTPFSRAAANRLEKKLNVQAYKIGSGECNNYPLIQHIASFGKPVILSTGMNNLNSIKPAVQLLEAAKVPYALLHCTSIYPTPYEQVRLGALQQLAQAFPQALIGLSDHSIGNYTCFAAIALGACIIEKHFTADKQWPGPDIEVSIDPLELQDLIKGTRAIQQAQGGEKNILSSEQPTIDFAYASIVTIKAIKAGEQLTKENIWVKRPGTGELLAKEFAQTLGKTATRDIAQDEQLCREDVN